MSNHLRYKVSFVAANNSICQGKKTLTCKWGLKATYYMTAAIWWFSLITKAYLHKLLLWQVLRLRDLLLLFWNFLNWSKKFLFLVQEVNETTQLDRKSLIVEFTSSSDGKEALARAANLLLMKHLKQGDLGADNKNKIFTESHMTEALQAVGLFTIP